MSHRGDFEEAARVMTICNACRYCEGFCAVFPAMERRSVFQVSDLTYLASLCHDCRACFYACQYAPPHEFAVNVPATLAGTRLDTYAQLAWPRFFGALLRRNGRAVSFATTFSVVVALLALLARGPDTVVGVHLGAGAFYEVVPYGVMVVPAMVIAAIAGLAALIGGVRFWQSTGGASNPPLRPVHLARAARDVLRLTHLGGRSEGCNYPDERFSLWRRRLHHLVFYGFTLDLLSTAVAAVYHHLLHLEAPYGLLSLPVVLGTLGGLGLVVGSAGLLRLKWVSDPLPTEERGVGMDVAILVLLIATSGTGLLLLALRETSAMGALLTLHLGFVAGLFLTLPYNKLVHSVYRSLALVRSAAEEEPAS